MKNERPVRAVQEFECPRLPGTYSCWAWGEHLPSSGTCVATWGCYSGLPQVHGKEVGTFAVQQELEVNTYSDLVVAHLVRVCFVHLDPHQSPHLRFPPTPAADVSPSPPFPCALPCLHLQSAYRDVQTLTKLSLGLWDRATFDETKENLQRHLDDLVTCALNRESPHANCR